MFGILLENRQKNIYQVSKTFWVTIAAMCMYRYVSLLTFFFLIYLNAVFFIPHSEMEFLFFPEHSSCSQASPMIYCLLPLWRPPLSLVVQTAADILPLEWFPLLLNELLSWHYRVEVSWLLLSAALCLFCLWPRMQDKDLFVFFFMSFRTSWKWLRIRMISFTCENTQSVAWRRSDKCRLTTHHFSEHVTHF